MKLDLDEYRNYFLKYTEIAFMLLPYMDKPKILDVGCGTGVPTILLAELSGGEIDAFDIDERALAILDEKIKKKNLWDKIGTHILDMEKLPEGLFDDKSFDIIWCEGALYTIKFKDALRDWKRYIKNRGYLVIHDDLGDYMDKISKIESGGYELWGFFKFLEDVWWSKYYSPIEKLIQEGSLEDSEDLIRTKNEIEMFKKNPKRFRSGYFIMRKK